MINDRTRTPLNSRITSSSFKIRRSALREELLETWRIARIQQGMTFSKND